MGRLMTPPEQTARQVGDIVIGAGAASLPFWAIGIQNWAIFIGALAGAILAVCQLVRFFASLRGKRRGQ